VRVVTFLAQFAIVQSNNLLSVVNAPIDSIVVGGAHSIVAIVYVDWLETNIRHTLMLQLYDAEGQLVRSGPDNDSFRICLPVEIGRPAGVPRGMTFKLPVALNLSGLHIDPGVYEWRVSLGDTRHADWNTSFLLLGQSASGKE
jgi:hypothetical protein